MLSRYDLVLRFLNSVTYCTLLFGKYLIFFLANLASSPRPLRLKRLNRKERYVDAKIAKLKFFNCLKNQGCYVAPVNYELVFPLPLYFRTYNNILPPWFTLLSTTVSTCIRFDSESIFLRLFSLNGM